MDWFIADLSQGGFFAEVLLNKEFKIVNFSDVHSKFLLHFRLGECAEWSCMLMLEYWSSVLRHYYGFLRVDVECRLSIVDKIMFQRTVQMEL